VEAHPSSGRNQSSSGRWKSFETVTEAKVSREVRAHRGKGRNRNPFRKVEVRAPQSLGRNRNSSGTRLTKTSIDSEPRLFVFQRHPRPRSRALPTREEPKFQALLRVSLSNLSSIVPSLHNSFDSSAAQTPRRYKYRSREYTTENQPPRYSRLQADKEPLRSGGSPSKRHLPSPQWPKPNQTLVRGPPAVMLPFTPAAFAT
jgi:hypothetical protein